ncbi:6-phosphogluconolactonase [Buchnera aphidicola (Thelaxes suberi)]|uniref:beta-propeller fold lactonase family protein n=1 Tax=Buchnera aphidicola TaxID=9 RepID=UPI0034645E5C
MSIYIYIATPDSYSIQVFQFKKNNKHLQLVQEVSIQGEPQPIYILESKKLLYVGIRPNNRINTYAVQNNGNLKKLSSIKLSYPINHISIDINKNLLFCSSYHGNLMYLIKLDNTGIPKKIIFTINNILGCHFSHIDIQNKLIYSTALKEDKIYIHKLCKLQNNFEINFQNYLQLSNKSGPRHLTFHHNKKYLYSINELNSTIDVLKINTNNKLKIIQNISMMPLEYEGKHWASDITITNCSNFLYTIDRIANIVTLFKIHPILSTLTMIHNYVTECQPRSFHIDKYGQHLYIVGQKSNSLSIYKIDPNNGELNFLIDTQTGKNPLWITTM